MAVFFSSGMRSLIKNSRARTMWFSAGSKLEDNIVLRKWEWYYVSFFLGERIDNSLILSFLSLFMHSHHRQLINVCTQKSNMMISLISPQAFAHYDHVLLSISNVVQYISSAINFIQNSQDVFPLYDFCVHWSKHNNINSPKIYLFFVYSLGGKKTAFV